MFYRRVRLLWALILVAGCAVYGRFELDERYGPLDPARYDRVPVGDPVRDEHDQDHFFTVLRNSAHSNVAHLFDEADRRLPDEDTVTLLTGFIGAYPNAFYLVKTAHLPAFVDTVRDLSSEIDYSALMARFASSHGHTLLVSQ